MMACVMRAACLVLMVSGCANRAAENHQPGVDHIVAQHQADGSCAKL